MSCCGKNIVNGAISYVFNLNIKLSSDRFNICKECDKFNHGFCKVCKCKLGFKTRVSQEVCPLGKW